MKHTLLVVLVVSAISVSDTGSAKAQCMEDPFTAVCAECQPRWSVAAGTLLLHRSKARAATLVEDGTTDAELSNVSDFDLGWAAGPDIQLNRRFDNGWDLGFRFFSIDGWSAARSLDDPGNLRVPLVSSDPDDYFNTASASYVSRFYNAEINLKRQLGERLRLLAGFRWVQLDERIAAEAWSPTLEGTFSFGTANHLYGFQMGAEASLFERGPLQIEGFLKAGIYGNHIVANLAAQGTYLDMDGRGTIDRTSFLGDLGLIAKYRLGRHWSVYGGYQAMWVDGVALAADSVAAIQVEGEGADDTLQNGGAFYHGALAGVEFAW